MEYFFFSLFFSNGGTEHRAEGRAGEGEQTLRRRPETSGTLREAGQKVMMRNLPISWMKKKKHDSYKHVFIYPL